MNNFQYFFFNTYEGYFLQVLPFAFLGGFLFWRFTKNRKGTKLQKAAGVLLAAYLTALAMLVFSLRLLNAFWYVLIYHLDPGLRIPFFSGGFNFRLNFWKRLTTEKIGNMLAFVPFGLLYPWAVWKDQPIRTVFAGCLCSLVIELIQPVFGRAFDVNDIALNTLGTLMGALVSCLILHFVKKRK